MAASNHSDITRQDVGDLSRNLDSLGYGIAVWTNNETLRFSNSAFRQRFGVDGVHLSSGLGLAEFLSTLIKSGLLIQRETEASWIARELEAHRDGRPSEYMFGDGTTDVVDRWPLPDGGVIAAFRDITLAKRDQRELQKARDDASAADESKSRFLRAANHDLRQPLASLKILIDNCMSAEDDEHRADLLHAMDVSVSIMEDLLGALLNIGQLDAGKVTPRITTFQLASLLERLDVQYRHQAAEKGLQFRLVPSKFAVVSDRALLERIVSNFVSNAIRYTETGGVIVGCRRDGQGIRLEVRDSGAGIAPEHREAIFDEFFRVSSEQAKHRHSLGLGLNISKRLADVLEHSISVRSDLGQGSVFSINLPLGDVWHSDIGEPEINERIGGEFNGLSALVLEDDENLRDALIELLERWGIIVSSLSTFDDINAYFETVDEHPDIVISDYRLRGGVKGTDVVKRIRNGLGSKCPAIVVTADTNPQLIDSIRQDGFPVLIKPVSPPSLRVMMHNVLYEPELVHEFKTGASGDGPPVSDRELGLDGRHQD